MRTTATLTVPRWSAVALALLLALHVATVDARTARFDGSLRGAQARSHEFYIGNGITAVFRDRRAAGTRYRVCLRRRGRSTGATCRSATTAARGRPSRLFFVAPGSVGSCVAVWTVRGRAVARWSFTNGPGD